MKVLQFPAIAIAAVLIAGCASDHRAALNKTLEFSKSPSIDKEWHCFAERLSAVIGSLQKYEFLILSEKTRNVYIQFAAGGSLGMTVEAVSEQFCPSVGKNEKEKLRDLGWRPPTYVLGQRSMGPAHGSCNYYIDAGKTPPAALADLVVRTFCGVYHTPLPESLQYQAFFDNHVYHYDIPLPALGLEPKPVHKPSQR